jgi:hypothetical protein
LAEFLEHAEILPLPAQELLEQRQRLFDPPLKAAQLGHSEESILVVVLVENLPVDPLGVLEIAEVAVGIAQPMAPR